MRNTVFFIGWMLSPLTFWNDAFVNIPLSYLIANLLMLFIRSDFLLLVLVSYWFTNALGLYMMYIATRQIFKGRGEVVKEILKLIATTVVYSLILVALAKTGVIRPLGM